MIDERLVAELAAELRSATAVDRLRQRPLIDGPNRRAIVLCDGEGGGERRRLINWASNDYLGATARLPVRNEAGRMLRRYGAGAGAARLLAGGLRCHRRLEQRLANWLGCEDVLLTTTGYQANLAALVSLAGHRRDAVLLDRLCHASLYDGARLAAGGVVRFTHNDLEDLERRLRQHAGARRRIVCVESIYSMDGDQAPLVEVAGLCERHRALLLVDEAHAIGVLGEGGRGLCRELGIVPDVLVGTCSKALGGQGGFLAGLAAIIELIVNRGRSFIYSTAPAPAGIGAALGTLDLLRKRPGLPAILRRRVRWLRETLREQGWEIPDGPAAIIPVPAGSEKRAVRLAGRLRELGHYAPAIRPPTVPPGACRLRLTVTLDHRESDLRRLGTVMARLREEESTREAEPEKKEGA